MGTRAVQVSGVAAKIATARVDGPRAAVARRISALVNRTSHAGLERFRADYEPSSPLKGGYELTGRVVANATPVVSILFDEYVYLGGAHPVLLFRSVVVDTRNGRRWSRAEIARRIRAAGRPGLMLNAEIRRAVAADAPVLGVNLGQLGYLAKVEPGAWQPALQEWFEGSHGTTERLLVSSTMSGPPGMSPPGCPAPIGRVATM